MKNPTATLSQTSGWNVSLVTDGTTNDAAGWAIYNFSTGGAGAETAVFETETNVGFVSGSVLTFSLYHVNHNPQTALGRFRLSYTTDARDTFADGLNSGGDVTANWTVLNPQSASATDGPTLTISEDGSILASGENPAKSVYTVVANTLAQGITGFRLEALEDPSLPASGPGRAINGNFVLTEVVVNLTPLSPTNPPPVYSDYVLSRDFSPTNNPNGVWTFGAKSSLGSELLPFTIPGITFTGGVPIEYWLLSPNLEPVIYFNGTTNTASAGDQLTLLPGTIWLVSGNDITSNAFGVVRFTAPAGASGSYLVEADVRPAYDGDIQGDTDFHVLQNGTEIFGRFLAPADRAGYTNILSLAAGDTVDFLVGRGQDNSGYASGLKTRVRIGKVDAPPTPPLPSDYILSRDFSPTNNPSGAWSYGAKQSLDGSFSAFGIRGLNPFEYWQLVASQEPTIYRNGTTNTITIAGGQGVFPPGTTFLYSGSNGATNGFGVVRFVVPAGGSSNYLVEAGVSPVYDSGLQGDTDFHVVKNGTELFGRFLAPSDSTGYTNTLALAAGDVVDFLVGRGQDGSGTASGLKINVNIVPTNSPILEPQPSDFVLSRDFSPTNNPSGAWSYGAKPSLDGSFSAFGIRGLNPFEYWLLVASQEPTIYRNGTTNTITIADGQGVFPPGTTFLYSGSNGATNGFGVVRFVVPAGGSSNYLVEADVSPVYDGGLQGDTDFHVVKNGTELFGRFLAPADRSGYTNIMVLAEGDVVDFMVGRGQDGSGTASGLKISVSIVPTSAPIPEPEYPNYVIARDFSPTNNPSGAWSYGAKPSLDGSFSAFGIRGLNPFEYWQLVASQEPTMYRNGTTNTITIADGQGVFPPGATFLYSGTDGATNGFGVVRFIVPAGGSSNYLVEADVSPVYDGGLQGDTDFHVVKNGIELFGRFLAPSDRAGYTNTLALVAGDAVDFLVGRGQDGSGTTSGLKINIAITPTSQPITPPPTNSNCMAALGMTGWWALDGDAQDTVAGNDGTLLGSPTFIVGQVGPAMQFDGANDRVRVPSSPSINVGVGMGFTLEAWINPADLSHLRPIAEWNSGTIGAAFWTGVDTAAAGDGERSLFGNLIDTSGISHQIRTPKHLVVTGEWQHVAITYDKASGASAIYYNGLVVASTNLGTFTPMTTGDLNLGNRPFGPFAGIYWKGGMDEVSLYGRSLAAAEVQEIYNAGAVGKCGSTTNGVPPWIIVQPQSQEVIRAGDLALAVVARGSLPLQYQWRKGDVDLTDATNATLALTSVQLSDAGPYSVVVSNDFGSVTSQVANVAVNLGPTRLRVISVAASAEGQVELPVELVANGNENALGFSLTFNPALLNFVQVVKGESAADASLIVNTNELANGRLGIALALPADEVFSEGVQQLVLVSFEAVSATQSAVASIGFGDQPVLRQVSDATASTLAATYSGGTVSIEVTGLEADVAPRPGGNNSVTIIDWVQLGRYVAALDTITNSLEFQKADSAPRADRGNGVLTVSDWVQAGRYAAGLDSLRPAGGPLEPAAPLTAAGGEIQAASGRVLTIQDTNALPGTLIGLPVWLESTGNENALAFTLSFDAANLQFIGVNKIGKMSDATLNVNTNLGAAGKIGFAMALPTGTAMTAGRDAILVVYFAVSPSATGTGSLSFGDSPVYREVADVAANSLSTTFTSASVTFGPPRLVGPPLTVARSGNSVLLFWPSTAQGFEVYSAATVDATNWVKVPGSPFDIGGRWLMTAPLTGANQYFRLEKK